MSIRKINFTNRIRIERSHITLRTKYEGTSQYSFDATLDFNGLSFPVDAEVVLEAYYQTERKRFYFGTVGNIIQPKERSLVDFSSFSGINFRLLIISDHENRRRIIGVADRLTPEIGAQARSAGVNKISILPVEMSDSISEAWKISFDTEEQPVLILNSMLKDIRQRVETDAFTRFLILPHIIRVVVSRMVYVDHAQLDDEDGIYYNWSKFLLKHGKGTEIPELDVKDPKFDADQIEKWVETMIENFCESFKLLNKANSEQEG